jgi:toxin ParE1/3/4
MAKYTLTNKAVIDLSEIWNYTVEIWSEKQADKYYFMLLDACQELADGKVKGRHYPEINLEILGFRTGQHVVFYRKISVKEIEITRILHAQMDLKSRIKE